MESLFHLHQPGFTRFVSVSFIVHIVILAIALFSVQGSQKNIFITPAYTRVNLIAPAVKKRKAPIKATKQARKKKAALKKTKVKKIVKAKAAVKKKTIALKKSITPPPPPAKPVEVKEEVSIDDAISRLEMEVATEEEDLMVAAMIERLQKKTEAEEREQAELMEELRGELESYGEGQMSVAADSQVPGQSLSSANAYEGLSNELFELQFKSYYNKIGARIQSLWIYPGDADEELKTLVTIKIHKDGILLDYWVESKSGEPVFDDSTLRAIEKAAPFPPLPADYNEESLEIGLRFCPGGCVEKL